MEAEHAVLWGRKPPLKTVATAKHFVLNNQETNRTSVSAQVDERTDRASWRSGRQLLVGRQSFSCAAAEQSTAS